MFKPVYEINEEDIVFKSIELIRSLVALYVNSKDKIEKEDLDAIFSAIIYSSENLANNHADVLLYLILNNFSEEDIEKILGEWNSTDELHDFIIKKAESALKNN